MLLAVSVSPPEEEAVATMKVRHHFAPNTQSLAGKTSGAAATRLKYRTIAWLFSGLFVLVGTAPSTASAGMVYVGDYSSNQIRRFDETGASIAPVPWASGLKTEGIACLMGAPGPYDHLIFAADTAAGKILLLDENQSINPIVNANFITGLSGVANIALSNDGHVLYVTQEKAGTISEYNSLTGALIKSINFAGAHDVLVGKDGSVYATAYGSSSVVSQGVWKYNADLTAGTQFIARNDNGLTRATGMAFDNAGNLWVANAGTINNGGGTNFVAEYTSGGVFTQKIMNDSSNHLLNVFGLTRAENGNLYAASFGSSVGSLDGLISEINVTTGAVSTFIAPGTGPNGAGQNPKYATSEADCVTYAATPEPSSLALVFLGVAGMGVSTWVRRRRNASIVA
jgi:hypothetical protein